VLDRAKYRRETLPTPAGLTVRQSRIQGVAQGRAHIGTEVWLAGNQTRVTQTERTHNPRHETVQSETTTKSGQRATAHDPVGLISTETPAFSL